MSHDEERLSWNQADLAQARCLAELVKEFELDSIEADGIRITCSRHSKPAPVEAKRAVIDDHTPTPEEVADKLLGLTNEDKEILFGG